jgi:uncharacterized protein (TIGR04168 family)
LLHLLLHNQGSRLKKISFIHITKTFANCKMLLEQRQLRIAIVGDIHSQWSDLDNHLLHGLDLDLVLFVGDLGNEDVAVAAQIAAIDLPKAIILGNHDAWYTASPWGQSQCPYDRTQEDRVQQQLDVLGISHVGYGYLDFPELNLSVVGSRPFSWGGKEWRNKGFYQERFGVGGFTESTARIVESAAQANTDRLIFISHNGPTGLGDEPSDICGRDWETIGGDYGDPDLAAALQSVQDMGKQIPLVAFGHMHHRLRHDRSQLRTAYKQVDSTLYLNAARCPRLVTSTAGNELRNFSIITLADTGITTAGLIWVDPQGKICEEEPYLLC